MAVTVHETSRSVSLDSEGLGTRTRTFKVTTRDVDVAYQHPDIPPDDSEHPQFGKFKLNAKIATQLASGHTLVECVYSNDNRMSNGTPNKFNPNWFQWGWDQVDVVVNIHYNYRKKVIKETSDGLQVVSEFWAWDDEHIVRVPESRVIRPLSVRIQTRDVRLFDPIAEQKDAIHSMPDGKDYRFLGGRVTQFNEKYWDAHYSWELDKGTDAPVVVATDQILFDYRGSMLRPPYHKLVMVQSPDPENIPHELKSVNPYKTDRKQGWRTLPGANRVG